MSSTSPTILNQTTISEAARRPRWLEQFKYLLVAVAPLRRYITLLQIAGQAGSHLDDAAARITLPLRHDVSSLVNAQIGCLATNKLNRKRHEVANCLCFHDHIYC